ncbi:crossover junction endodeoxyribonuclease RuvC [Bacillus sp. AG4(2022)]|uniref:crossover junction endodeoxyribonuclease RuvC n=1 Tax=Bacillus sp. AG4(2022) TaxID=2962594 RepID=UPI0028814561|nr:crossover junction endodeoxyribonuclease RuvC [Bacillus sp. AG4(2022)]MDT0163841.1 crossover junction endodeoxyribonuclease RuvC [Bacillus sp. AG4(2022)]
MRFVGIDPSTKTGFVALDEQGEVLRAKELTGIGSEDPMRMITMIDDIMDHIRPGDQIVIEGFGYASQQAIQLGGIGWGIRMALMRRGHSYTEVAPGGVKKFATGKGNSPKEDMVQPIAQQWGFQHSSDNVLDAYVMAQISMSLFLNKEIGAILALRHQLEVIDTILNPKAKPKKKRKKKAR